jgi:hypothetical protein
VRDTPADDLAGAPTEAPGAGGGVINSNVATAMNNGKSIGRPNANYDAK